MHINADFSRVAIVRPSEREWVASPSGGVQRCMLDRIGGEVARATSLVRFAPGSAFPAHTHGGGEEFLVLDGTFSDETGDFPAGTYVRNPIGTAHAPRTREGCTLFVKLWQFHEADDAQFRVALEPLVVEAGQSKCAATTLLHDRPEELVRAVTLAPGGELATDGAGGSELLVLTGSLGVGSEDLPAGSWLRLPDGIPLEAAAGADGARVWIKTRHLADAGRSSFP